MSAGTVRRWLGVWASAFCLLCASAPRAAEGPTPGGDLVLDEFETNRWTMELSGSPEAQMTLAPGHSGLGLQLSYDLKAPGAWVGISRSVRIPQAMSKSITFYYKLDAGDRDRVEIRVTGDDGAVYHTETPVWPTDGLWRMTIANLSEFTPVDEKDKGKPIKSVQKVEIVFWSGSTQQHKVITLDDLEAMSVAGGSG